MHIPFSNIREDKKTEQTQGMGIGTWIYISVCEQYPLQSTFMYRYNASNCGA